MAYDVIIIGGGLSGLMAGVTAAKRGRKVLLLEKHITVGGLAAGFSRKGYYFDAGMSRCLSYIQGPLRSAGIEVELKRQRLILNVAGRWVNYGSLKELFADLGEVFSDAILFTLVLSLIFHNGEAMRDFALRKVEVAAVSNRCPSDSRRTLEWPHVIHSYRT